MPTLKVWITKNPTALQDLAEYLAAEGSDHWAVSDIDVRDLARAYLQCMDEAQHERERRIRAEQDLQAMVLQAAFNRAAACCDELASVMGHTDLVDDDATGPTPSSILDRLRAEGL